MECILPGLAAYALRILLRSFLSALWMDMTISRQGCHVGSVSVLHSDRQYVVTGEAEDSEAVDGDMVALQQQQPEHLRRSFIDQLGRTSSARGLLSVEPMIDNVH